MLSRRTLLTGSLALIFTPATGALAQQFAQNQAEWSQNYEAVSRTRVQRTSTRCSRRDALAATEQMIEYYRNIAARGGWQPVQGVQGLRVGSKSPAVIALRQRLIITGDLDPTAGESPIYDSYVEAGVRRFQARHGISSTGTMTAPTVAAMNVPVEMRIRQLEINVGRLRSLVGRSRQPLRGRQHPGRSRRDGGGRRRPYPPRGRRRQDRPSVAAPELEGGRGQFQPVLDGARLDHQKGSDPEDAEGAELPDGQQDPHLQRRPGASAHARSTGSRTRRPATASARIRAAT